MTAFYGILLPFLGTILGAGCAFFLKRSLGVQVQRALTGFAAGVMVAASIWSLLIPAMEQGADMGKGAVIPAAVGFWLGILFLLILDRLIPHLHRNADQPEGVKSGFGRTTMMLLAVTLHNIPRRNGGRRGLCRLFNRKRRNHSSGCVGIIPRYRHSKLPGGCYYIYASAGRGNEERASLSKRCPIRHCRAAGGSVNNSCSTVCCPRFAVFAEFCRRSYDLCGSGRTDS